MTTMAFSEMETSKIKFSVTMKLFEGKLKLFSSATSRKCLKTTFKSLFEAEVTKRVEETFKTF